MSTTSRSNWLGMYLSHSARRFSTDCRERGVWPVIYKRRAYRAAERFAVPFFTADAVRFCAVDAADLFRLIFEPSFTLGVMAPGLFCLRANIEAHEDTLGVREVADNFANGLRKVAYQGRNGKYLVVLSELGGFYQVDDVEPVTALQMLLTNFLQIPQGDQGFWCLTGDVQAQLEGGICSATGCRSLGRFCFHLWAPHEFTPSLAGVTPRFLPISSRSRATLCWRSFRCRICRANSASPDNNSTRQEAICDSRTVRLAENSLRFSSNCCRSRTTSAFSRASCARRAEPV